MGGRCLVFVLSQLRPDNFSALSLGLLEAFGQVEQADGFSWVDLWG